MNDHIDFSAAPDKPTSAFEDITPDMARALLQLNRHNRHINPRLVQEHVRAIVTGNYLTNGETIKLSWPVDYGNGGDPMPILLDGQHRLEAISQAERTVNLLVVRGLDPKSQSTMDIGRKRTGADWLHILREKDGTALATVLGGIWKWNLGDRKFLTSPKPTPLELEALLSERPEIRRSLEIGSQVSRAFPALKKSSLGVTHHLISQVDKDHVAYFFRLIETGANLSEGHPVLALRWRANSYRRTEPMTMRREVGLLVKAWNFCARNETTKSIIHPLDIAVPEVDFPSSEYLPLLENADFRSAE
jgi:hypothetical protein